MSEHSHQDDRRRDLERYPGEIDELKERIDLLKDKNEVLSDENRRLRLLLAELALGGAGLEAPTVSPNPETIERSAEKTGEFLAKINMRLGYLHEEAMDKLVGHVSEAQREKSPSFPYRHRQLSYTLGDFDPNNPPALSRSAKHLKSPGSIGQATVQVTFKPSPEGPRITEIERTIRTPDRGIPKGAEVPHASDNARFQNKMSTVRVVYDEGKIIVVDVLARETFSGLSGDTDSTYRQTTNDQQWTIDLKRGYVVRHRSTPGSEETKPITEIAGTEEAEKIVEALEPAGMKNQQSLFAPKVRAKR